ncbi:glycoside hydrolase family 97 protein [Cohnella zeiphila]|uniref:Glycoside hydrolase family 97 catalytic domain-containing protein n=1 Tax=Cohnella zeiphila TaxID=2761120 RepID=A0A7X0SGD5_9BACL|nr:glycoside hydrolase family 97 protein [Cohnella zeiphila]MBB6729437.1 glycoside hydrolase family 97 catalytic domain-containing protein [Cohnella zeiphila]
MSRWQLSSPDGRIRLSVGLNEAGSLCYEAEKDGVTLLAPFTLGLETDRQSFSEQLNVRHAETGQIRESYTMPHGSRKTHDYLANELILHAERNGEPIQLHLRASDDGIAYRFEVPASGRTSVVSERSGFTLAPEVFMNVWAQKLMKCYERTYDLHMPEHMVEDPFAFPMLLQCGGHGWMLLTEAAVYGTYCASHLRRSDTDIRTFVTCFPPDQSAPVQADSPLQTPWRVAILANDLDRIVNSSLVLHLNPPSELEDTSWIRPGRAAWSWYSDGASCGNMDIQKAYVDFAAEFGWEYSLVDGGWDRGELDVPELVRYGRDKGVGIWLWSHYRDLKEPAQCEKTLALWANWGIVGVKVDFFDSDSQDVLRAYDTIAGIAADHRLMVNYHGSTKPSGEQRRWPHVMTREGIYGAEYWRNISEGPNAVHNCTVPFIRNAVGSMDYTPVTFSRQTRTSHCHQLALSVVFESAVQHFADSMEAYRTSVAHSFLRQVPAAWDESRLLEGFPGRFVTMARRDGEDWFVGAICAAAGRTATIDLDFLTPGSVYEAEIYEEEFDEGEEYRFRRATDMTVRTQRVTSFEVLRLPMKVYGGCAIRLTLQ